MKLSNISKQSQQSIQGSNQEYLYDSQHAAGRTIYERSQFVHDKRVETAAVISSQVSSKSLMYHCLDALFARSFFGWVFLISHEART
jgi:hypothetical protein